MLVTVLGLRARATAPAVANPIGELRQRAKEGLDLLPLAPRTEMDLSAAGGFHASSSSSRPTSPRAHPHGVAMAALALSMSTQLAKPPWSPRAEWTSTCAAVRCPGGSIAGDCFICASGAIRRCSWGTGTRKGRGRRPRGGGSRAHRAAPPAPLHEYLWLRIRRRSSATSPPRAATRDTAPDRRCNGRSSRVPDARFVIAARGNCGPRSTPDPDHRLESTVLNRVRPVCCPCTRRSTSRHELGDGGTRPSVMMPWHAESPRGDDRGGDPGTRRRWETDSWWRPAITRRGAIAITTLLKDEALRRRMGEAAARAQRLFSCERMVQDTLRVYERVAMTPPGADRGSGLELYGLGCGPGAAQQRREAGPAAGPPRGQSSNVTAAPFAENVTPRTKRAGGVPSGSIAFTSRMNFACIHRKSATVAVMTKATRRPSFAQAIPRSVRWPPAARHLHASSRELPIPHLVGRSCRRRVALEQMRRAVAARDARTGLVPAAVRATAR